MIMAIDHNYFVNKTLYGKHDRMVSLQILEGISSRDFYKYQF